MSFQWNMAKEYNISKTAGQCGACQKALLPGEEFIAAVREVGEELAREDFCPPCWQAKCPTGDAPDLLGVWRTHVPQAQEKKKLFIDDELLRSFFERLEGAEEDAKVCFRYVLALILMRKRVLVYDRMQRRDDGVEVWQMHFKGSETTHHVIDPKMDETKIAEVSSQLGQILEGEL